MPLNLTPEDEAEYGRECRLNNHNRDLCIQKGDVQGAKRYRQKMNGIYHRYAAKSIREPAREQSPREKEHAMTIEQRILRIEERLQLGWFDPNL